jgi:hypothetical protein
MSPEPAANSRLLVQRTRCGLSLISLATAMIWALAGAWIISAIAGWPAAVAGAVVILAGVMWRDRAVWSMERVALWIEEHHPRLEFALVTALDRSVATAHDRPVIDMLLSRTIAAARVDTGKLLVPVARRRIGMGGAALALSLIATAAAAHLPVRGALERSVAATGLERTSDPFAEMRATVIPPAYSHLARREIAEPSEIRALVGSQLLLQGRGRADRVSATVGAAATPVRDLAGAWEVLTAMPGTPVLLRLGATDGNAPPAAASPSRHERLVTLIPIVDAPPSVQLLSPTRDSVLRRPTGTLVLGAQATDDIGLVVGHFEIVITAGDEDEGGVRARTLTVADRSLSDSRAAHLDATVRLDTLGLSAGSVLSIRALASDGNTVSGPGIGASDTRTFRIARPDEYDSVAIEAAAPSVADSSALSERIVIVGTTRLIARMGHRPSLSADSLARTSRELADQQDAVGNAITSVMSADDENELPIADVLTAPERALLDSASYAMGEAAARLSGRAPRAALPSERRALLMVDSARSLSRRLYLRSRPPRLLVDVDRIRLSGTDRPDPSARSPGRADTGDTRWLARLVGIAHLLEPGPDSLQASALCSAAVDSLVVLRVAVLSTRPELGGALTRAIDAIHTGRDPRPALGRARALLTDPATTSTGLRSEGAGP